MPGEIIVELRDIKKEFPGVLALDRVNMQIRKGSVMALVGENGAGKSTLMKILSGTYTSYEGAIVCDQKEVHMKNEKDAFALGISIVAQELNCVDELTIAENLFLGREQVRGGVFLDRKGRTRKTKELLAMIGLPYEASALMGSLSVAQKQMIEILKSISRNCRVIIMDEPTSALTSLETEIFFKKVNELKEKGIAFVFISHRLEEVFYLCDEYTVLRDGHWIASGLISEITQDQMISLMVGRDIADIYPPIFPYQQERILEVEGLSAKGVFENVSFEIRKGEILGFAGMMGAGRSEIARAIFGMDSFDCGEIRLEGEKVRFRTTGEAIKNGVVMVTEDRAAYGFVGVRSIEDNIVLPNSDLYTKGGWKKRKVIHSGVTDIFKRLSIKAPGIDTLAGNLSGGNQQKVVLAKWLVRDVKVLILDEPTRGIDVGAKQEIYKLITELAKNGMAILLISSDMPEVLSMSHKTAVVADGKIAGILPREEATQDKVMKMIVEAK